MKILKSILFYQLVNAQDEPTTTTATSTTATTTSIATTPVATTTVKTIVTGDNTKKNLEFPIEVNSRFGLIGVQSLDLFRSQSNHGPLNPLWSQSTNEIIDNIIKRAALELGIKNVPKDERNLGMARSSTTLSNVVLSNTSGITANILFQPGKLASKLSKSA